MLRLSQSKAPEIPKGDLELPDEVTVEDQFTDPPYPPPCLELPAEATPLSQLSPTTTLDQLSPQTTLGQFTPIADRRNETPSAPRPRRTRLPRNNVPDVLETGRQ